MNHRTFAAAALLLFVSVATHAQRSDAGGTRVIKPLGTVAASPRVVDLRLRPRGLAWSPNAQRGDGTPPTVQFAFEGGYTTWITTPALAVGPEWVLAAGSGFFGIYSKQGEMDHYSYVTDIFGVDLNFHSSFRFGRAHFDADAGRFVVVVFGSQGNGDEMFLAVSDDDDPHGVWTSYSFLVEDIPLDGREWNFLDPSSGTSDEGFVMAGKLRFNTTTLYNGTYIVIVPKEEVYAGQTVTASIIHDPSTLDASFGRTYGSASGPVFGAARIDDDTVRMLAVTGAGSNPLLHSLDLDIAPTGTIPLSVESTDGGSLRTNGQSVTSIVRAFDRLYLGFNYPSSANVVGGWWSEIDTQDWPDSGLPVVIQSGVSDEPETSSFLPSIGVNRHRDVTLLMARSSKDVTHDASVVGRIASDPSGVMSTHSLLSSTSTFQGSNWPIGRQLEVAVDPEDGETFWGAYFQLHDGVFGRQFWVGKWWVSRTHSEPPWSFDWTIGTPVSGTLNSFNWDDDFYFYTRAANPLSSSAPAAQVVLEAVVADGELFSFGLDVVARVNTPGLAQRVELWDWTAGEYVDFGTVPASVAESLQSVFTDEQPERFIEATTRAVRARLSWSRTGPVIVWPWTVAVEQVRWRPRLR